MEECWPYSCGSSDENVAAWQINRNKEKRKEGQKAEELEKDEEEESYLTLEVLDVFKRLVDIKCPFLEGLHITELKTKKQLLCSPSMYRLTILEWLFVRLYPPSEELFSTFKDYEAEEKILELVKLGNELMLCGPDDQNLIKGYSNVKEQLCFFKQLLHLASNLDPGHADFFSSADNFHNLVMNNEMLLHKLFSSNVQQILNPQLSSFPLDIECHFKTKKKLKSSKNKVKELSQKLNEFNEMLEDLKEFAILQGKMPSKGSSNNISQAFRVTLSDLHQLIVAFFHVYETEWQEHTNRPTPNINPCGSQFHSVYEILTLYNQELKAISEVINTSKNVEKIVKGQKPEKVYVARENYMMSLASKMEKLRQKHKLFQDPLQKPNES
ncbi:HAUS augmin-like complex subunit 7 [Gracilinanus agilis]|uniref:HAUS augmin-like complex subunit 7 n=1 Tax=Gracilinanus agilis TaxID=191870 RepID=UPI001CFDFF3E|nr:HAUS augmin-like complex subunit 7 [Gracilinanus agilis]